MADYYPLIARAVEGLSDPSPEIRQAVFERARTALMGQLRSLDPPLSEVEIQQERLSLDVAISRVEAECASRTSGATRLPIVAEAPSVRDGAQLPALKPSSPGPQFPSHDEEDGVARPRIESRPHPGMRSNRRARTVVLGMVLALVIGAIAAVAFVWRDKPESLAPEAAVTEAPPPAGAEAGKIGDRVGAGQTQAPPEPRNSRAEVGGEQRAVFYEEDTANPQAPKAQVGRVVWRLEDVDLGQGQPLGKAVSASIDIPDAGMTMKMLMRRNLDATLPASHTVELNFTTRTGDTGRVIRDVGLLQFKNEEAARGTPVAGLPVSVRENLFLIGLSSLQSDVERNTELFVRRNWVDLPVRMASGQRAILSFEKGASGEQILNSAFSQWQ